MDRCKVIHVDCYAACSVTSCEHFLELRSEVLCTVHSVISSMLGRIQISFMLGIDKRMRE